MTEEIKLKCCPFCGGKAKLTGLKQAPESWVECTECGARTRFFSNSEEAAVSAWNARKIEDKLLEKIVKLATENSILRLYLAEIAIGFDKDGLEYTREGMMGMAKEALRGEK